MSKGESGGEEVGDHSEPVALDKEEGGVYALVLSRERGEWGACNWLVEGILVFVEGGEEKANGEVLMRLVFGCVSWGRRKVHTVGSFGLKVDPVAETGMGGCCPFVAGLFLGFLVGSLAFLEGAVADSGRERCCPPAADRVF